VRETDVAVSEIIVCEAGVAIAIGLGFTKIITGIVDPAQPFARGATV
jgi:hypothetical protein